MTKEERAEKWSRGIPEMECLTQQEKEEICRRVTFQLLVLTGILAGAALCCLSFLSLEDPAFFDVLNHSADKVNEIHKNVHSMAKRQGAAVMSLPYVIPLVLPIVIPVLAVVYFLKKPLLRREAGKLSQRWRLETDVNTTVQFASEDIKKTMELLQKDDVQYLILTPPAPVMGSLFMQTAHDEGNLFTLEISKAEEGGSVIYGKERQTGEQVLYALQNYRNRNIIPDTSGWEKLYTLKDTPDKRSGGDPAHTPAGGQDGAGTFLRNLREKGEEMLNHIYWDFDEKTYTSVDTFSEDLKSYMEDNRKNWKPEETAVKAGKVYIVYEAFLSGREELLANEKVVDESDLDEENRIDGLFQTDIEALLSANNGSCFTSGELLMKVHNQLAGKDLGDHYFFEGLERVETEDGIPCWRVRLGS